ncbi:MAG: hypothetical protein Q8O67_06440 [Deltaproteobacteria bacterium]|nr:hypothetical protein [Deltaproteobacteria bacterium]
MSARSLRSVPDLSECPTLQAAITADLRARWRAGWGPDLDLTATTGAEAAAVVVVAGTLHRARELFVFARGPGAGLEGPLAAAVDVADALLARLFGGEELRELVPLDWEGQPTKDGVVFVRGELRDYGAEELAAKLLGEEALPRALPWFPLVESAG